MSDLSEWTPEIDRRLRQIFFAAPNQLGELYMNNDGDMIRRPSKHTGLRAVYNAIRDGQFSEPVEVVDCF